MEQVELSLMRLNKDMAVLKARQTDHECQIDVLAVEIHNLRSDMNERFLDVDYKFKGIDRKIDDMRKDLKLVLEALAIKY